MCDYILIQPTFVLAIASMIVYEALGQSFWLKSYGDVRIQSQNKHTNN